jgi:hypothetical protein
MLDNRVLFGIHSRSDHFGNGLCMNQYEYLGVM